LENKLLARKYRKAEREWVFKVKRNIFGARSVPWVDFVDSSAPTMNHAMLRILPIGMMMWNLRSTNHQY
jgi:hypothetical protein